MASNGKEWQTTAQREQHFSTSPPNGQWPRIWSKRLFTTDNSPWRVTGKNVEVGHHPS
jgi:hypothetical protein